MPPRGCRTRKRQRSGAVAQQHVGVVGVGGRQVELAVLVEVAHREGLWEGTGRRVLRRLKCSVGVTQEDADIVTAVVGRRNVQTAVAIEVRRDDILWAGCNGVRRAAVKNLPTRSASEAASLALRVSVGMFFTAARLIDRQAECEQLTDFKGLQTLQLARAEAASRCSTHPAIERSRELRPENVKNGTNERTWDDLLMELAGREIIGNRKAPASTQRVD